MDPLKNTADPAEAKLHFLDYWRVIRIRKTIILAVFLLVVITTTVVTFFLPQVFSSKVRIAVDKENTVFAGIGQQQMLQGYDPYWLTTEYEKIKSQSVLDQVITNKSLDLLRKWTKELSPDGTPLRIEEARVYLKGMIDVRQARSTSLIEIWAYSRDKNEASDIAQTIAEVYRDSRLKLRRDEREKGIEKLRQQLLQQDTEVTNQQAVVNNLRNTNHIHDLGDELMASATLNKETLRRYDSYRSEAKAKYDDTFTLWKAITNLNSNTNLRKTNMLARALTTALPGGDTKLAALIENFDLAQQKLVADETALGPEHPDVKKDRSIAVQVQEQINDEVQGVLLGLGTKLEQTRATLDSWEESLTKAKAEDADLADRYNPYYDEKRKLEGMHKVRDALSMRIYAETVDLALPTSSIVEIIDKAEPGLRPVKPNKPLNIALGIVIGLIVGVGLAFFIEYLDTSVKTIDDVERALQAAVLAVIPQNVGSLLDEGQESPHAEAYRVLRTNILFSRKDDKLNTVSVVSGGAGEGKSTTLFNLAVIFAQNSARVLLVDSDLRRPSLHKILKVSNATGLTNYLLNQQTLEQVIQTTPQPGLDFLPSGKLPSSSMGVLSSSKMKDLVNELKRRYDFVFFDSPPIMGVSDASILASQVDMVLQVIQYRRYPQPMTIRAKQMIQKVGGNLIGIVLNNINMSSDENYYYYSGYYYDYYSKQDDDAPTKKDAVKKNGAKDAAKLEIKPRF